MIKSKHKHTAQELYWERRKREEEERDANLPPGLINHGNTCFMNSTLQGLIATRPLHDLVYFRSVAPSIQPTHGASIVSRKSPQLTNGHGLGGPDEAEWSQGMPLGDIFTTTMRKAWDIQDAKRRETMSPKEILTTIGRKYDQYMDFRQQDAHEFLRHMLDAMRMEELDIIKKRQPPPPKTKRKRLSHQDKLPLTSPPLPSPSLPAAEDPSTSTAPTSSLHPDHERPLPPEPEEAEEKLVSFVDMLFGGQLASILVCEKCKKVSVTYEDFNDLSLSIKPEDYVKDRKRDRIKKIARKLRIRPTTAGTDSNGSASARGRGAFRVMQRASSVPASPVRRSSEVPPHEEEPPTNVDPRRRSFDHPGEGEEDEARDVVRDMVRDGAGPTARDSAIAEGVEEVAEETVRVELPDEGEAEATLKADEWTRVEAETNGVEEKGKEKRGKDKDKDKDKDDPWGKLARRISVSMKLGARDKDREKDKDSRPSSRASDRGRKSDIKDAFRVMRGEPRSPRTSSLAPGASVHEVPADGGDVSDAAKTRASSPVPASPRIGSPLVQASRPNSRRSSTNPFKHHNHHGASNKSPAPPKASDEEMAYLRRILADIHPVTGNPLSMLQHALIGGHSGIGINAAGTPATLATHALWAKMGHLPGVEECLRMFTAVEILDGENMVGCHRCWKIANGTYRPHSRENGRGESDDDSDTETEESDQSSGKSDRSAPKASESVGQPRSPHVLSEVEEAAALSSPDLSSGRASPASTSAVSTTVTQNSSKAEDTISVSSAPTAITLPSPHLSSTSLPVRKDSTMSPVRSTFGGLPIPQISTTEPDTPESHLAGVPMSRDVLHQTWSSTRAMVGVSLSDDSLLTPKGRRRRRKGVKKDGAEDSGTSSDDEFDDSESDTSAPTSVCSDGSASPSVSPRSSVEKLSDTQLPAPRRIQDKKVPRAKRVVPRRMYKRYLISTPPPILVIHLKRFQQMTKSHTVSLSGGFKKLDEFVSFPEYLDLAPFLAPKREDFVGEKRKRKSKQQEQCMYRLYAVVVHIGNMLGGHYIAYTALPPKVAIPAPGTPSSESEKSIPSTTTPSSYDSRSSQSSDAQHSARQWAYISDANVRLTTLEEVLKAKAYICMYERV